MIDIREKKVFINDTLNLDTLIKAIYKKLNTSFNSCDENKNFIKGLSNNNNFYYDDKRSIQYLYSLRNYINNGYHISLNNNESNEFFISYINLENDIQVFNTKINNINDVDKFFTNLIKNDIYHIFDNIDTRSIESIYNEIIFEENLECNDSLKIKNNEVSFNNYNVIIKKDNLILSDNNNYVSKYNSFAIKTLKTLIKDYLNSNYQKHSKTDIIYTIKCIISGCY